MYTDTLLYNLQQQQQNGLDLIFGSVLLPGSVRTNEVLESFKSLY